MQTISKFVMLEKAYQSSVSFTLFQGKPKGNCMSHFDLWKSKLHHLEVVIQYNLSLMFCVIIIHLPSVLKGSHLFSIITICRVNCRRDSLYQRSSLQYRCDKTLTLILFLLLFLLLFYRRPFGQCYRQLSTDTIKRYFLPVSVSPSLVSCNLRFSCRVALLVLCVFAKGCASNT